MSLDRDKFSRRSGTGGSHEQHEIWTGGRARVIIPADGSAVQIVTTGVEGSEPAAPVSSGVLFFRTSGGKVQFCVRFPTGAIQILATEP